MEYIKQKDYDYIINKYHDTKKPFDHFNRFVRHDEIFDPSTGLDSETIKKEIFRLDGAMATLSHPVRKAKALEYVLKNTRISCDPRDIYPAINMSDRPVYMTLSLMWKDEVFRDFIPEIGKRRSFLENNGIITIWPDYAHTVPVWDRVFALGFKGLLDESERARLDRSLNEEEEAFFEGIKITYEAIIDFVGRLAALAEKTEGSEKMAKALKNIQYSAPSTFYEATLLSYIYFMVSEHVDVMQVRSLSNFDRLYYPLYKNDLENGVSEEEIRKTLAYFFLQFTSIGNYYNQPVFLGGENADGSTVINELSYLFLDVYDKMQIYNPKVQIKVCKSTPKDFLMKALDMIRRNHNSIVLVNDDTIRRALVKAGATEEEARLCDVKGCYEYAPQGANESAMQVYFNLLKPLEFALHEGRDGVKGVTLGFESPKAEDYANFDEFYSEYKKHLVHMIEEAIYVANGYEQYLEYISPQSLISATIPTALERARDYMRGGGTYNTGIIQFGFLADAADSLTAIKKYVFDGGYLTLGELRDILDKNFEGHDDLRIKLLSDRDKYGNNKPLPDFFAKDIVEFLCSETCGRPTSKERGGSWNLSFHVARMSYTKAPLTAASPNGRRKGEELSKNISASIGMNREGATAAILSATKIDATAFTSDAALDLGLLPSAVSGDDGLEAMYGLLMTFCQRGGHALHINVFDANTLREAQANPEKYKDLQIRVCGWNVLWNNINRAEQDAFIRQAEALV